MKALLIPMLIFVLANLCQVQAQDPPGEDPNEQAEEDWERVVFFGGEPIDLGSLKGKPVKFLEFMACDELTDLAPIRGLKLEELMLWKTSVESLEPLAGMPLRELVICGGRANDLSPLKGLPLQSLELNQTPVSDISPLEGMPLKVLSLFASLVSDISPLQGMPLEDLDLSVTTPAVINDLSALKDMKLKSLDFDANPVTKGIDIIREMKSLKEINGQTPDDFWKKYDADAPARELLWKAGAKFRHLGIGEDGTWTLDLDCHEIRDFSFLKGLPIEQLTLARCNVADVSFLDRLKIKSLALESTAMKDLSSLRALPLENLTLNCPEVVDLLPLKGLRLQSLYLKCPKVRDLSALEGMPLDGLHIKETDVRDVSVLKDLPLEYLSIDLNRINNGIDHLRKMKSLKRINWVMVEEFWEEHDEAQSKEPKDSGKE